MIYLTWLPERPSRRERSALERQAGWALLRYALSRRCPELFNRPLRDLLTFGPHGKPYLLGDPFYFNLSHSGGVAVCAAEACEVGVDVERKRVFSERLQNRICTLDERGLIEAFPEKHDALTQLWTCKESSMKYTGLGLAQGILATEFDRLGERPRWKGHSAFFASVDLNGAFLTLCTEGPTALELCPVSWEALEEYKF